MKPTRWGTTTIWTPSSSFQRQRLHEQPYPTVGIGRNGADSEPSCGGGLSAHETRQYPKGQAVNATSSKGVPTCRLLKARDTIPPSLATPRTESPWQKQHLESRLVDDRGNGGLAPPAVHHTDTSRDYPVPLRCGSPVTGLQT